MGGRMSLKSSARRGRAVEEGKRGVALRRSPGQCGGDLGRSEMEGVPLQSAGRGWRPAGSARTAKGGEGEGARGGIHDSAPHRLRLGANDGPGIGGQNDDGDISAGEILLIRKASIGGDERFETSLFGFVEQLAVDVAGAAHFRCGAYVVAGEYAAETAWNIFVEQDPHPFEGGLILA